MNFEVGDKVKFQGGVALEIDQGELIEDLGNGEWFIKQDETGNVICRFEEFLEKVGDEE